MLELEGVSRRFGSTIAVDNCSLTIPAGQMVGIIGRSGAGKSTLLRMINRLIAPSGGRIAFDGTEISALKGAAMRAWQHQCAMIFQQFNLVPRIDVVTNVLFGTLNKRGTLPTMFSIFPDADIARAISLLERLDIAENAAKRAEALSGGQQQRVAIARALMQDPKIVLADEPIASLDPMNAQIVMENLRAIHDEDGKTVICNLHTLDTARTYCDRIIGMRAGRVVFDGVAADLTTEAAREIYGADEEFSEEATSTNIESLGTAPVPEMEAAAAAF